MKKPLEIDMIAGTQVRDSTGEILDINGANIDNLSYFNDNHGSGFMNRLGYVVESKKIMKADDCSNPRHEYYWNKVKSPFIYARGFLYDNNGDHPNAKACAAILRNIHREDIPYKLKASVEGATIARGIADKNLLAQTKIVGVALTFTPANHSTLVEPLSIEKSESWEKDKYLIESISHLAKSDIPNFRHIERKASAELITDKLRKIHAISQQLGIPLDTIVPGADALIRGAIEAKVTKNISTINELVQSLEKSNYGPKGMSQYNPTDNIKRKANRTGETLEDVGQNKAVHNYTSATMGTAKQQASTEAKKQKSLNAKQPVKVFSEEEKAKLQAEYEAKLKKGLSAGYGSAGIPTNATGGSVLQTESLEPNKFKYITCRSCGDEQIHSKFQVKCRKCNTTFGMEQLAKLFGHD